MLYSKIFNKKNSTMDFFVIKEYEDRDGRYMF